MTNGPTAAARAEFLLVEYQVASEQYRSGVDLGISTIKALVTLNGLLLAAVAAISQARVELKAAEIVIYAVAAFAIVISAFTATILPYYFRQLSNCQMRCQKIEAEFGGALYSAVAGTESRNSPWMRAAGGLTLVCGFFVVVWLSVIVATAQNPALFDGLPEASTTPTTQSP